MSIPNKIKIGCFDFKVTVTNEPLVINDKAGFSGICDYNDIEIKINESLQQQRKEQTFWHEVCHAFCDNYDIELGENTEKVIDAFARGIYGVLKDNPFLLPGQDHVKQDTFGQK